jgi:hypothetical protein
MLIAKFAFDFHQNPHRVLTQCLGLQGEMNQWVEGKYCWSAQPVLKFYFALTPWNSRL